MIKKDELSTQEGCILWGNGVIVTTAGVNGTRINYFTMNILASHMRA